MIEALRRIADETDDEAAAEIARDAVNSFATRPLEEVERMQRDLTERVWYQRHIRSVLTDVPRDIRVAADANARRVEEKYEKDTLRGVAVLEHDRNWAGHLEGWMAAIRWVLDPQATEETEYLYDT